MKLVSIISAWACTVELLPYCIANHLKFSDSVIVVWSQHSNHWEKNDAVLEYILGSSFDERVIFEQLEPSRQIKPLANETRKRNHGIELAKKRGFTHFLLGDADEMYLPDEMNAEKEKFSNPALNGLVHPLKVYIGKPTYWTHDHTLVCGIHKLEPTLFCGNFREYPFAIDPEGKAHIDPSRRLPFLKGIEMSPVYMLHFSYVRKDIDLKIDNSSANLKRSRQIIYEEIRNIKPGCVSKLYHQPIYESENYFNIEL
jgi:hypothetical protein